MRGHDTSVSEIEFCTLYVVAKGWILGCILRFMHAKNHFSDTLIPIPAQNLGLLLPPLVEQAFDNCAGIGCMKTPRIGRVKDWRSKRERGGSCIVPVRVAFLVDM
jgi:hypothetical protein